MSVYLRAQNEIDLSVGNTFFNSNIQLLPYGLLWKAVLSSSDAWKTVLALNWADTIHETQRVVFNQLTFASPAHFPEGALVFECCCATFNFPSPPPLPLHASFPVSVSPAVLWHPGCIRCA